MNLVAFMAQATTQPTTPVITPASGASQTLLETIVERGVDVGLMVVAALATWLIGAFVIKMLGRLASKAMSARRVDPTLARYLSASLGAVLKAVLIVVILGIFGIETTSFAAFFAAVGIAIGMAWSGLLANFAAGVFIMLLRPIKVGDFVTIAGVTGTVREIGLFVTALDTPDNVRTIVGNGKVFGETMSNFSVNSFRRVDLVAQLAHGVDYKNAIELLRMRLPSVPHVSKEAPPSVEILEFNALGPVLCVRPYTHTDTYWEVFFATNRLIKDTFGEAGYPVPELHYHVMQKAS